LGWRTALEGSPYKGNSLTLHEAVSQGTIKADMKVSATLKK
jgi:hypothetical protein